MIKTFEFIKDIFCLLLLLITLVFYIIILIPIKIPVLILERITFMLSGLTIERQITETLKDKTGNEIATIKYDKKNGEIEISV